ncbi:MAG: LamG-like jellyroll fold domain-containing protein, partial [Candidatus Paceibacterota bacterium]
MPSANNRQFKTQKAFTLIELLIVIAIIGILAGMAVVSMSGATDKARIAKGITFAASIQRSMGLNCVGNWGFDEGSGTSAIDLSGSNSTGTIIGASHSTTTPYGNGIAGQYSLSFDGIDDKVTITSPATARVDGQPISVAAWVYWRGSTGYQDIVAQREPHNWIFYLHGNNHELSFHGLGQYRSTYVMPQDQWKYVVATVNETGISKIYADGQVVYTNPTYVYAVSATSELKIGSQGSSEYFNGLIDDVRIYNSALPASAIRENYLAGLEKLLAGGQITKEDYQQRLADL